MSEQPQECWIWTGTNNGKGYGQFKFRGKKQLAHRVMWQIFKGEIPEGKFVCHTCDTPACVNPDHLFLCTKFGQHQGFLQQRKKQSAGRA